MNIKTRVVLFTVIGIIIVITFIYLNNPIMIYSTISHVNPLYVLFGIIFESLAILLSALGWHLLLRAMGMKLNYIESLKATLIAIFGDIMIPTASLAGETFRILYVRNKNNGQTDKLIATAAFQRLIYTVLLIVLIILGIFLNESNRTLLLGYILWFIASMVFLIVVLVFFVRNPNKFSMILKKLIIIFHKIIKIPRNINKTMYDIDNLASGINEGIQLSKNRKHLIFLATMVMTLQWIFGSLMIYSMLLSLGYKNINYIILLSIYPIYSTLTIMPIGIPAALGVVETGMTLSFIIIGIPRTVAASATLLIRGIMVWFDVTISGSVFIKSGKYLIQKEEKIREFSEEKLSYPTKNNKS
ncbi:MAG: lysylphosphatidylglycerol synthase transmembrane domain-containing protein [Thermoprotei archaeon]